MDEIRRICMECKHCEPVNIYGNEMRYYCNKRANVKINLVTGKEENKGSLECYGCRFPRPGEEDYFCSKEGKWWEPKENGNIYDSSIGVRDDSFNCFHWLFGQNRKD